MSQTKTCGTCKETKPVSEFYRRGGGKPGYRYRCKACENAARLKGQSRTSRIAYEIAMHYRDPSFPLSPEAEAVVYTSEPLPPRLVALCERRKRLAEQGRLRRNRELRKLEERYRAMPLPPFRYEVTA
ncbi:MAG: hypothetical protein ACMUJI_07810 [Erythrobacter sp.]|uniref:hypothetical protein n=1 Tax=Erythrobacter sp. TaxID=1042 RepID=UPI003A8A1A84